MRRSFESTILVVTLRASSEVVIDSGSHCSVEALGGDAEKVRIEESGGHLLIDDSEAASAQSFQSITFGNSIFFNSGVFMSGGRNMSASINGVNIRVVDGVTYVNGQRVDTPSVAESSQPLRLSIVCPPGLEWRICLRGCGSLTSSVPFATAHVTTEGGSDASFVSRQLTLRSRGSSEVRVRVLDGAIVASAEGSSSAVLNGHYQSVHSTASGSASISTSGTIDGDFWGDASGSASVVHSGRIRGSKSRSTSGCGRVDWC